MNNAKQRGTRFESEVVAYLQDNGFPYAERRALAGNLDKGDVLGVGGWCLELKDHKAFALAEWADEAKTEAKNAGARWYAVIAKRRRAKGSTGSAADAYVILSLAVFVDLLRSDQ